MQSLTASLDGMPSYDCRDFFAKLVSWRAPANDSPPTPPPPCLLPLARTLWRAAEWCVPIAWLHHLAPPGEHQLSSLVRASGLPLPWDYRHQDTSKP